MKRILIWLLAAVVVVTIGLTLFFTLGSANPYREAFPLIPGVEYGMSPKEAQKLLGPCTAVEQKEPTTNVLYRTEERTLTVKGRSAEVRFEYIRLGFRDVLQSISITVPMEDASSAEAFAMDALDVISAAVPRGERRIGDSIDAANDRRMMTVDWQRGETGTNTVITSGEDGVAIHGTTNEFHR